MESNIAERKLDLIHRIGSIKEAHIINDLKKFLDFELDNAVYQLTAAQQNRILEAQKDETITEEQANEEIEKWLQEK